MPDSDLPPLPKGFFVEPVPHTAAVAWLRDKPPVASSVFKQLLPELKARAFAVAGVESANVLRDIRAAIAAVPAGADWDKQKRLIADMVHPYVADPDEPKNKKPARRKAELLLRTHGFQAYAIGQHAVMREQQNVFPFWQYLTMSDELVRPTHAALNKLILPASSPFWHRHSPPWDWGCRCRKVPYLPEEVDEIRTKEQNRPPESKTVIEGEALRYLETQNRLDRGPNKIFDMTPPGEKRSGAFLFEPDSLRLNVDQLKARYDMQTWADFADWAQKTPLAGQGSPTVWEWMSGGAPAPGPAAPAPVSLRRVDDITARVSKLHTQRQAQLQQVKSAVADLKRALDSGDAAAARDATKRLADARTAAADLLEAQREAVGFPVQDRGTVKFAKVAKSCKARAQEGADLTARYTHRDLMPTVGVVHTKSRRAFHRRGNIHINKNTSVSTVMHEITHATEQQNAEVLKACQDFLKQRAGAEKPQLLRRLTGLGYRADEYAYEDEFAKRGGDHYMGKLYGHATEILTMGIERIHDDPGSFLEKDSEYFNFLLSTLQKL